MGCLQFHDVFFCQKEAEKLILGGPGEVANQDTEVAQPESEDEETVVVYHSSAGGFVPDWGVTADGFED